MNTNSDRNPVLLVHGINDTGAVFYKMAPYLSQLGWSVYDISLTPNNGKVGLDELAAQVADLYRSNICSSTTHRSCWLQYGWYC